MKETLSKRKGVKVDFRSAPPSYKKQRSYGDFADNIADKTAKIAFGTFFN
jgi:hypothetical protein